VEGIRHLIQSHDRSKNVQKSSAFVPELNLGTCRAWIGGIPSESDVDNQVNMGLGRNRSVEPNAAVTPHMPKELQDAVELSHPDIGSPELCKESRKTWNGVILPVERARRDDSLRCSTLHTRVRGIRWKPANAVWQAAPIPIIGSCHHSQYSQADSVLQTLTWRRVCGF